MRLLLVVLPLALLFLAAAPALAQDAAPVAQTISAAQGGEVTSASGRATLRIPAEALGGDAEVTIAELAPGEGPAVGPVIELQPDGLAFQAPATLTVHYSAADVPEGYRPEDVAIMQVLPRPEPQGEGGMGAAMAALAGLPYQNLETTVDLAAGTATAQLAHLSRYAARAYATFDLDEWDYWLPGAFDFGQAYAEDSGAADARSAYDLSGGYLEAIVQVPIGQEGQGWALASLWQTFRVTYGTAPRETLWWSNRDIEVPFTHDATVAPETNTYDVHYVVWLASSDPSWYYAFQPSLLGPDERALLEDPGFFVPGPGVFVPRPGTPGLGGLPEPVQAGVLPWLGLSMPSIYWQSFCLRPWRQEPPQGAPPPYRRQAGSVVFEQIPLRPDHFYTIGVSLYVVMRGKPARGERPPEGGAVSFLGGDFAMENVHIRQPREGAGG